MKAIFLTSALFLLTIVGLNAQNLIAVQNGGEPTFYQQVDDAIVNAQNGDTIYIPGGTWDNSQPINKRLHLVGVGHNPDATTATFATTLNGGLWLKNGAGNGSITGVCLKSGVYTYPEDVNHYSINRCHIYNGFSFYSTTANFMIIESIIEGNCTSSGNAGASNFSFFNNIISMVYCIPFDNSVFRNNIFLNNPYCRKSLFENNIFLQNYGLANCENSTAKNNLHYYALMYNYSTNVGVNNIPFNDASSIFVDQEGNVFNYAHDYHLKTSCPGKNAGTDGTDVGIYGGIYPWKEGSIPFNPHFQKIQISPTTDNNGNLNVNIKVAAQER